MPYNLVPSKFEAGKLHSGSKTGPVVKSQKQMVAILLSEKRKADAGKTEYQPKRPRMTADQQPNALARKKRMYG